MFKSLEYAHSSPKLLNATLALISVPLADRPEIQLRFPAPQHGFSQNAVHRRLQLWVLLQQGKCLLPRLLKYIGIPY
jgi:hypothetical protein